MFTSWLSASVYCLLRSSWFRAHLLWKQLHQVTVENKGHMPHLILLVQFALQSLYRVTLRPITPSSTLLMLLEGSCGFIFSSKHSSCFCLLVFCHGCVFFLYPQSQHRIKVCGNKMNIVSSEAGQLNFTYRVSCLDNISMLLILNKQVFMLFNFVSME